MGVVDPLRGPSSASMTCSDRFKFNPNYVNISCPNTIFYLPLVKSHVTTFVVLSAGKVKSTLTLILVVIFTTCLCHCIAESFSGHSISTILIITIAEVHPQCNIIRKFKNFALPLPVFIHSCRIGE